MGSTPEGVSIPSWLNNEFLTEVISRGKNENICIREFDVKAAVPKGDNYLSTLYRLAVEAENAKRYHLILKTLPAGEAMQKFLSEMRAFEKEVQMYEVTLPTMYRIMKEAGKFRPLSARCYPTERANVIVLEDLQHLGYKMAARHRGLDLDHSRAAVKALARLHVASIALHNADPTSLDKFSEGLFLESEEKKNQMQMHFKTSLETLASNVGNWPGYEHYADKVRALIPTAVDHMISLLAKGRLKVLNHGDCWLNNMMFCYNKGRVQDVRFVDFQISRFASPALDLQYFLCTSLQDDIRFSQREFLLREYHDEFIDWMEGLGLDDEVLTLQQLKQEFQDKEMFGLLTCCTVLCAVVAQRSEAPDLSSIKEGELERGEANPLMAAYSGTRFREVFQQFLLHYDKEGLL